MSQQTNSLYQMTPIGYVESCFREKFGTPRQANLVESASGRICMVSPYDVETAFEGLELCSHIWVSFCFHHNRDQRFRPKVRPPRLGGNASVGVFASRSPYRPNALGLSAVQFAGIERERKGLYIYYRGGDMVDGSPVVDIKPYLPYADCLSEAQYRLNLHTPKKALVSFASEADFVLAREGKPHLRKLIADVLQQDPRPRYQSADNERVYVMQLDLWQVYWCVETADQDQLRFIVTKIEKINDTLQP